MHGDFSRWQFDGRSNDQGILQQQGRLLLDNDVNHQTFFSIRWQQAAGRDFVGRGVAGVTDENPDAFRVRSASADGADATLTLGPGNAWVNGNLVYLPEEAAWLAERIGAVLDHAEADTRDAVILEVWLEAVSGFQDPRLLEPALGGVDTTERLHLATALRLVRMEPGERCTDVARRVGADPPGRLTVRLEPGRTIGDPDCPIEDPGGYRGPEHHLYRIEGLRTNDNEDWFKWSRFGGGLVGRGEFDHLLGKIRVTANQRAIATSGLTSLFVEALVYDDQRRHYRVIYGGHGTLANPDEIDLGAIVFGSEVTTADPVFIRVWDGAAAVAAYPAAGAPLPEGNGIVVAFHAAAGPGDFWTFPVRAGLSNPATLLDAASPEGVHRARVPLAVLTWNASHTATADAGEIEDCRRPIAPLTRRDGCCTIRVGDGVVSFGDVTSLQAAIDRLPPEGGTICVLPGRHPGGHLSRRRNVTIHGCGPLSEIVPPDGERAALSVSDSHFIHIHDLAIDGGAEAVGVRVGGTLKSDTCGLITIERLWATAQTRSAIHVTSTTKLAIRDCVVSVGVQGDPKGPPAWAAITIDARDASIERNLVMSGMHKPQWQNLDGKAAYGSPVQYPSDEVIAQSPVYSSYESYESYKSYKSYQPYASYPSHLSGLALGVGLGGIWLRGGCERVRVIDNDIVGGLGHGVTLGHADLETVPSDGWPGYDFDLGLGWPFGGDGPCAGCADGGSWIPWLPAGQNTVRLVPGDPLDEILIADNRIRGMGMSGIGVAAFFGHDDNVSGPRAIRVDSLAITDNVIQSCLARDLQPITNISWMGYAAIALADSSRLRVSGNDISAIGTTTTEPVCGLYVWFSFDPSVQDNRMTAIGRMQPGTAAGQGARGGIWFENASRLVVRGNDIAAQSGPALRATIIGGASITDNLLASASIGPGEEAMVGTTVRLLSQPTATAPNVLFKLGAAIRPRPPNTKAYVVTVPVSSRVTDRVIFSDNQVACKHSATGGQPHTGIAIIGFNEVQVADNQCALTGPDDGYATHATLIARTLRVNGNRFAEDKDAVLVSTAAFAERAIIATNIADHCLIAAATVRLVAADNIEGADGDAQPCQDLAETIARRVKIEIS